MDQVSFWDDERVLKFNVVMVAQLWEHTKSYGFVYFKWLNYMVCKLYHNTAVFKEKKDGQS